jgi:hypothetical protein
MIHDPLCVVRPYMTPLGIAITPFSDSDTCEVCNLIKQVRVQTAEDIIGMLSMNIMNSMIRGAARTK